MMVTRPALPADCAKPATVPPAPPVLHRTRPQRRQALVAQPDELRMPQRVSQPPQSSVEALLAELRRLSVERTNPLSVSESSLEVALLQALLHGTKRPALRRSGQPWKGPCRRSYADRRGSGGRHWQLPAARRP